jgi:dTDP-4-dehydrorhamnose 3,5-epimerase-like enzyme
VLVKPLAKWSDARGWLCEMFRRDELPASFDPAMGYMSMTEPGVLRGPHEANGLLLFRGPVALSLLPVGQPP